mmetsp:Transcript_65672/g.104638  ORF Transcript_65672/g.104638 Transcript_65672/m.104638 type:complete len:397 (+) Transcript_65672:72-1262(+)
MRYTSVSRIFENTSNCLHHKPCATPLTYISTQQRYRSTRPKLRYTSALSKEDNLKLIRDHKYIVKDEFERASAIRSSYYRAQRRKLEAQKPEHHSVFSRVFYKPAFPETYKPTDLTKCSAKSQNRPKPWNMQRTGVIAKKIGMTTMFDDKGVFHPITILKMDAVQVVRHKGVQNRRRGTFNMQLGYGSQLIRQTKWRELGAFNAHNVCPKEKLMEFQVGHKALIKPGTEISCRHFLVGQKVDVQGISRDKGFQGVMKRWGFKGGPATHGSSKFHRRRGAMGGSMDPGKVWKGKRMPGHMGNNRYTQKNLIVFRIEPRSNLLYLIGHAAGYFDKFVRVRDSHFLPPESPPFPTFFPDPNEKEPPEAIQWGGDGRNKLWMKDPNMDEWKDDRVTHDLL